MTSRERVLASIDHRQPDRVPLDLGATPSSGISAIAYNRLKNHLQLQGGHTRIYDVVQQVVQPEENILDMFGVDVIDIGRTFNEKDSDWYDITLSDGSTAQYGRLSRRLPGFGYGDGQGALVRFGAQPVGPQRGRAFLRAAA